MEAAKARVQEVWDREFKKKRKGEQRSEEEASHKTRLVRLMHELTADTDILFGRGFNPAIFKDAFKITNLNVNIPDIEHQLLTKEHLTAEEKNQFVQKQEKRKTELVNEAVEHFEAQKVLMKALQDHLYLKYQFPTLVPSSTADHIKRIHHEKVPVHHSKASILRAK
jgi:hypothetical protein